MAKFKRKQEKINARQATVEEQITWPGGSIQIVPAGQWIVEDDDGNPLTTIHDSVFSKKYEAD